MLRNLLRWARITKPGTDADQFAVQQMEYLGKTGNGVIVFPYGLHGNVPDDALALMFAVQGDPENRAAIAWTPQIRPTLKAGEVAFYHPPTETQLLFDESGNVTLTTVTGGSVTVNAATDVTINAPTLTINGDIVINGTMTNNGKDVGDTHEHAQGNDSAGNSEQNISGVL